MKKLIPILSTLTITSAITPLTIAYNEIDDSTNSKEIIDKDFNFVKNYWYFSNIFTSPNFNKLIFLQKSKFDNIFWAHQFFAKLKEENGYDVLKAWVNGLLSDDCYENFSSHYRLNAREYQDLKWKDIIEEFERFLYQKYEIKFKIEIKNEEKDKILNDGLSKLKIDVSLFKINEKWKILTSDLGLKIWQNEDSERLITLKKVWKNMIFI